MASQFGHNIRVSIFGQSHSRAIGVNIDGLPAGEAVDLEGAGRFLARRAPGKAPYATARREAEEQLCSTNHARRTGWLRIL